MEISFTDGTKSQNLNLEFIPLILEYSENDNRSFYSCHFPWQLDVWFLTVLHVTPTSSNSTILWPILQYLEIPTANNCIPGLGLTVFCEHSNFSLQCWMTEKSLWIHFFKILFIYLWLCWVLVSVRGLSPVAASGGHSSSRCAGLSLSRPLLLRSAGFRRTGSVIVAHRPSCSMACGILPDQGPNPRPLHRQADSQPLHHQGSPCEYILIGIKLKLNFSCRRATSANS